MPSCWCAVSFLKTLGRRRRQGDMSMDNEEDTTVYKVVVNHEEQFSIWPADRASPLGWREVGTEGTKRECLDYIEAAWVDMRPLSVRNKMREMQSEDS